MNNFLSNVKEGNILIFDFKDSSIFKKLDSDKNNLFGVTFDADIAYQVHSEGYENVFSFDSTNIDKLFGNGLFDTIIFDNALHKIFTREKNKRNDDRITFSRMMAGRSVILLLSKCWDLLKDDGVVLIDSPMKPHTKYIYDQISFKPTEEFLDFFNDYKTFDGNPDVVIKGDERWLTELTTILNIVQSYINGTIDTEYAFIGLEELIYYVYNVGFEPVYNEMYLNDDITKEMNKLEYYNLINTNKLPPTNFLLKLRKK